MNDNFNGHLINFPFFLIFASRIEANFCHYFSRFIFNFNVNEQYNFKQNDSVQWISGFFHFFFLNKIV